MESRSAARLEAIQRHISPDLDCGASSSSAGSSLEHSQVSGSSGCDYPMGVDAEPQLCFADVAGVATSSSQAPRRRAVIVQGVRTPFIRSFGELLEVDAIDLGVAAVGGLLKKTKLDPKHVNEIIWGNVVLNTAAPNVAREIVIDLNLPSHITGVTVSRACLSGLQAIMQAVMLIEHGEADCVIAGGSDSLSNGEMPLPRHLTHALAKYQYGKKKGIPGVIQFFKDAGNPLTWMPRQPSVSERSTGKTMGYHADLMAELNKVSRDAQDALAIASHNKAAAARKAGKFSEEIVPVTVKSTGKVVASDNLIRDNQDPSKMSKLKPVFRTIGGTVTAASSSALTDGGSCVLVMSEEKARELGYPTDIRMTSFATTGIDPFPQLLLAPALAIPKVLDQAGLRMEDVDVFEIHEAFAAQVLSTTACLASSEFCKKRLGRDTPVGTVPMEKMNPNGSSIALGHPFAATGGRCVIAGMNELRRSKKKHCLVSICAAGGLGGACIISRED